MDNRHAPALVRFEKLVKAGDDGCHYWMGAPGRLGYGYFWNGERAELPHRFAYRMANGRLGNDDKVLHSCDHPGCVNPAHLRIGTMKENTRDCINRGRRVNRQKLTDDQVKEMAWFFELGRHTFKSIGEIFDVHWNVAYQIKHRKLEYATRVLGPVLA